MPLCNRCTQGCNCTLSQDGFWGEHPELGRNTSTVAGSGTEDDPYVISFIDQPDFRVGTAEIHYPVFNVPRFTDTGLSGISDVEYEFPLYFLLRDPGSQTHHYVHGNYFYIGASVTFADTGSNPLFQRRMIITSYRGDTIANADIYVAAAQTGPGTTDPITLSAAAIIPGVFYYPPGLGAIIAGFDVFLWQDSPSDISVSNLKVWVTQL